MNPSENGKTILLAENERIVRTLVFHLLQQNGYHVITGVDGEDALKTSQQFKGTIDLLLSDINMPGMTGIELARQMQIERPGIRVLLMSGMSAGVSSLKKGWEFLLSHSRRTV